MITSKSLFALAPPRIDCPSSKYIGLSLLRTTKVVSAGTATVFAKCLSLLPSYQDIVTSAELVPSTFATIMELSYKSLSDEAEFANNEVVVVVSSAAPVVLPYIELALNIFGAAMV